MTAPTQRHLDEAVADARRIGVSTFRAMGITVGNVLSSTPVTRSRVSAT
jgi:hypothetical protein